MNKLNLFNCITEIEEYFVDKRDEYNDFYLNAIRAIGDLKTKIIESNVKSLVKNSDIDLTESKKMVKDTFDIDAMEKLPTYSPYNPFVWLRISSRKTKELNDKKYEYVKSFQELLKEVKNIEKELSSLKLKQREKERLNYFLGIKKEIQSLLKYKLGNSEDLLEPLLLTFTANKNLTKNNFLSLITINHDLKYWDGPENKSMEYIKELPDEIDYETFRDAIFINKLEHDQDCYLFDIYMDDMLKEISQNKELGDATFDKFQEIFGPVPTYTATTDEDGELISLTPNKPKLEVVK